jgi:hypothetical protein
MKAHKLNTIIEAALKGFPERMTKQQVIENCQRYVLTDERIWIKHTTFAAHVMNHRDMVYDKAGKTYTNYQVKDLKGKFRVF